MRFLVILFCCLFSASGFAASAQDTCPGNPDALGTSRVLAISPNEFKQIGSMQYRQTLPLDDHEVVITFDDGPLPPYTNAILDTLASQCVKATYFLVGQMANAYPSIVRRIYNDGHTVGTHSQDHPLVFQRLSLKRVEDEVDRGIASVDRAIGDSQAVAPFFRIPGLGRSKTVDDFLLSQPLVTWSADVVADDWFRHIKPETIVERAMRRLEANGRGILLLHDIHPATATALPTLLKELKARGFHVVQVVAKGDRPKSVPELMASPATGTPTKPMVVTNRISGANDSTNRSHHVKRIGAHKRHLAVLHSVKNSRSSQF